MSGLEILLALGVGTAALLGPLLRRHAAWQSWLPALFPAGALVFFLTRIGQPEEKLFRPWMGETIAWSLRLDGLALLFGVLIAGIGVVVMLYAGAYMPPGERTPRFFAVLTAFMVSMLGLVLADDVFVLFTFWELTSVTSYLLIAHRFEDEVARKRAMQAIVVTGAAGLAMLAGFVMIAGPEGARLSELKPRSFDAAVILILIGCVAKSAQFPLHFWLPNAMEAPTPVSAFLHSATMVKAGVYLLARLSPTLAGDPLWGQWLMTIGGATVFAGLWISLSARDLKRLLAASTIGALGMLVFLLGIPSPTALKAFAALLVGHSLYKASLFLLAGAIDHATHRRDLLELGGLKARLPQLATLGVVGGLAMAGLPPFLSFAGKEYALLSAPGGWIAVPIAFGLGAAYVAVAVGFRPFFAREPYDLEVHPPGLALWVGPTILATLGLAGAVALGPLEASLLLPAAQAIRPDATSLGIAVWPSVNAWLALSLAAIGVGAALAWIAPRVIGAGERVANTFSIASVEAAYHGLLAGTQLLAIGVSRAIQHGKLRHYMARAFLVLATMVGIPLVFAPPSLRIAEPTPVAAYEAILLGLGIAAALLAIFSSSRLAAVAMLGIVGFSVATTFLLLGAIDLAITQVLVESLTVLFFVLVFFHLPRFSRFSSGWSRARDLAVSLGVGTVMGVMTLAVVATPRPRGASDYFAQSSVSEAFGRNVVNTILVDFRALDTLGEITVLALATLGVYGLIHLRRGEER